PKWAKLSFEKAALLSKENRKNEAASLYREVLKQNPAHPAAKIHLGELEYFEFRNLKSGVELVKTGLESDRVERAHSSKAYVLLAVQFEREQKILEAVDSA